MSLCVQQTQQPKAALSSAMELVFGHFALFIQSSLRSGSAVLSGKDLILGPTDLKLVLSYSQSPRCTDVPQSFIGLSAASVDIQVCLSLFLLCPSYRSACLVFDQFVLRHATCRYYCLSCTFCLSSDPAPAESSPNRVFAGRD